MQSASSVMFCSGTIMCPVSVLILSVMVSLTESVPTFAGTGAEKEVAPLRLPSLLWSTAHLEKRSREQPIQLCGYRLLEAVRGLCRGNYVGYSRRSDPEMRDEGSTGRTTTMTMMMMKGEENPGDETRYRISSRGDSTLANKEQGEVTPEGKQGRGAQEKFAQVHLSRFRRNIIDDCCKKPCSVNEMLRYCARA